MTDLQLQKNVILPSGSEKVRLSRGTNLFYTELKIQEILNWLSTYDFSLKYSALRQARAKDTGLWLLRDPSFREWERGESGHVLWCHGIGTPVLTWD
jgi:hypothetical protein